MNGSASVLLDEDAFGEKSALQGLRTFDAFPKTKPSYTTRHARGGQWTVALLVTSLILSITEFIRWYHGSEDHQFSVEKGVGHELRINIDIVVAMSCRDLHVNVQDASGDRILAGDTLAKDPTNWHTWVKGKHSLEPKDEATMYEDESDHLADIWGQREAGFSKTPKYNRGKQEACRIYGSMELNKVQGDFHITARGHGYMEFGEHLDHNLFNFSHITNHLSFGPHYPSLHSPLSNTIAATEAHFQRYQYFLSLVPTIYTESAPSSSAGLNPSKRNAIMTNQYAVTQQSQVVGMTSVPGIFFKFDIEPILLTVSASRGGFLKLAVRIVNVVSGVLVGGGWLYQMIGWAEELLWRRRKNGRSEGMLNGRAYVEDAEDD